MLAMTRRLPFLATLSLLAAIPVREGVLATTAEGRPVAILEVAAPDAPADRPVLLLVAGIRGDEAAGPGVVEAFVERLAAGYGDDPEITAFLDRLSVAAVPLLNPDGLAIGAVHAGPYAWNGRPWDDDGDGRVDEDPPLDRNGDGVIGVEREAAPWGRWREADVPDDHEGAWIPGMVEADALRGEEGGWLYREAEGGDADGDGSHAEDGVGGISLDMNFGHGWQFPHGAAGPGPHAMSEAESKALADWLLARPQVTFVIAVRDLGGGLGIPFAGEGKPPAGDADAFEAMGERFAESTWYDAVYAVADGPAGQAHAGSLLDWAYAGLGRWALAPGLWSLPTEARPAEDDSADDSAEEGEEEAGADRFPEAWHEVGDEAWAEAYGYLGWTPGPAGVEAAGWPVEGRLRVPAAEAGSLVGSLDGWLLGLADDLPVLQVAVAEAERLGPGTVRLEVRVWNSGRLATDSEQAGRANEHFRVRVEFPGERDDLLLGAPEVWLGRLDPGESASFTWVVKGSGEFTIAPEHPRSLAVPLVVDLSEVGS